MRAAVVEDDMETGRLIGLWLEDAGYSYELYPSGKAFQRDLSRETFDIVILDWMLPDVSGDELLQWIREHLDWPVPVIFATARDSEEDIVRVLSLGADDYLVKPLRHQEFIARIRAVTRRAQGQADARAVLEAPPYQLNPVTRTVIWAGQPVELTQKEFDLALFLFRNRGRMLSRGHILESVWGQTADLQTRTVDTHISRIRSKLGLTPENGWRLNAVYNHGYRLEQVNNAAQEAMT